MRLAIWIGATSGLIIAAVAVASMSAGNPDAAVTAEQPVLTVEVTTPQPRQWRDEVLAHGSVAPWHEAAIGAEVGDLRLIEVHADVGSYVAAGELLARFDPTPVQAELNERIAVLAEAEAMLTEAEENAQRAESLRNTGAVSAQSVTQAVTRARVARAQVDSARARVESIRLRLRQTRVVAPDAGVISARSATLGSVASPGDELFRLVRQQRLEWHARIATSDLGRIEPGQVALMTLPDGSTIAGTVRQIAPVLAQNLSAVAYVQLGDDAQAARIGMFASGAIVTGVSTELSLPSSSVFVRDGREYVFVLDADSIVTQAQVRTGRRDGEQVEILEGISPSQPVVLSGGGFLHDGDRVRVVATVSSRAAR